MKTYLGLRVFESWTRCGLTGADVSVSPAAPVRLELGRICCQLTYIELESLWETSLIWCWAHSNLLLHHGSEGSDCVCETQKLKTNPWVVSEVSKRNGRHRLHPVSWLCSLQDDVGFPDAIQTSVCPLPATVCCCQYPALADDGTTTDVSLAKLQVDLPRPAPQSSRWPPTMRPEYTGRLHTRQKGEGTVHTNFWPPFYHCPQTPISSFSRIWGLLKITYISQFQFSFSRVLYLCALNIWVFWICMYVCTSEEGTGFHGI